MPTATTTNAAGRPRISRGRALLSATGSLAFILSTAPGTVAALPTD
ncbi:hypothetical protein FOE67_27765, partial [Streptomyces calidiresistens]|nr:hypothetical protein [Streptomyces calidiresistens]